MERLLEFLTEKQGTALDIKYSFFKCFPSYIAVSLKFELHARTLLWPQLTVKKRELALCIEIQYSQTLLIRFLDSSCLT